MVDVGELRGRLRVGLKREELDEAVRFDFLTFQTEISMGLEAPVKGTDDPVLETLYVFGNHLVDLGTPRRELFLVLAEGVDGLSAQIAHVIHSALEGMAMVEHEDDDHVMRVATGLLDVVRENVVGPSDEIVGALVECLHNWVLDDIIGEIDVKSIFDKCPARFAAGRIPADVDVGLKVGDDALVASTGLNVDGLEEELKGLLEASLRTRRAVWDAASPEISRKLPRVELDGGLFLPRSFSGHVLATEPESVHDNIRQNVSLACHHAVTDIVEVE